MTHTVVQSDIEFASRLIEAGCSDTAIVAWLCWRGLEEKTAVWLLDNLRHNRLLCPGIVPGAEPHRRHVRKHSPGARRRKRHTNVLESGAVLRLREAHAHRPSPRRLARRVSRYLVASLASLVILFCAGYVGIAAWHGAKRNAEQFDEKNPDWQEQKARRANDIPDPGYDNLKATPPSK